MITEPTISEWKKLIKFYKLQKSGINNKFFQDILRVPNMRRYYPISRTEVESYTPKRRISPTDKDILTALEIAGFTKVNLDKNLVEDPKTKQNRKIGRVLTSLGYSDMEKYYKKRNNSRFNENDDYAIVISAHPYDILRASYQRSWTSCLDPRKRFHFNSLLNGICEPTQVALIAYLIKAKDRSIKKPIGRTFLNGYSAEVFPLRPSFEIYGHYSTPSNRAVTHTIFDVSCDFYGKFPQLFKHRLSEITRTRVNADSPLVSINGVAQVTHQPMDECTYYLDNNSDQLWGNQFLRSFNRPAKTTATWVVAKDSIKIKKLSAGMPHYPTINDIIKDAASVTRFKYYTCNGPSDWLFNSYTLYRLITASTITNEMVDQVLKYSKLKFYQYYNLFEYNPHLLQCEYLLTSLKSKGVRFEQLIKHFTK
jgi:hypothetical protein